MNLMVLGATGFIGPPLVRRLASLGHEVIAVARGRASEQAQEGVRRVVADYGDPAALAGLASDGQVSVVIDLLAKTVETTQPVLDALAGRIARYVLVSSGDVYRQYDALHRRETLDAPSPLLAEGAPLRTRLHPYRARPPRAATDPLAWMDAYDKIPIERALAARADLSGTIVRLPMVYGPGDRQRRFAWAIGPMLAGRPVIEIDAGWAAWRSSYGYVDDVAAGIALSATHPGAADRTYNLGPCAAPDHFAWAERFAQGLDWRGELRIVDRSELPEPLAQRLDGLDLSYPLVTDTRRIRDELGYAEVTNPSDALRRTVDDERRGRSG